MIRRRVLLVVGLPMGAALCLVLYGWWALGSLLANSAEPTADAAVSVIRTVRTALLVGSVVLMAGFVVVVRRLDDEWLQPLHGIMKRLRGASV
ncbi:MAG: hypothetical protein D6725_05055, partial [Planctomycetota bacterium]